MCRIKTGSTYQGVCLYFNASQGNGVFNLASEMGWILWLSIWQFHFHTLRKWWFYTCWLSPCVKWLFHHCQRQMPWTPSCHTELLHHNRHRMQGYKRSLLCNILERISVQQYMFIIDDAVFTLNSECPPEYLPQFGFTKMPQTRKEAIYYEISRWKFNTGVIHHLFQGRCTAVSH